MVGYAFTIRGLCGRICPVINLKKTGGKLCLRKLKKDHVVGYASVDKKMAKMIEYVSLDHMESFASLNKKINMVDSVSSNHVVVQAFDFIYALSFCI